MPRSHHCGRCGDDLTRVRALREPVYGLPLVRCGACGLAVVRRRHPIERVVHGLRVADLALGLFATQLIACALATALACICSAVASRFLPGSVRFDAESVRPAAAFCVLGAIAVGAWLGLAFTHLRLWLVASLVVLWVWAWIAVPYAVDAFEAASRNKGNEALPILRQAVPPMIGTVMLVPIAAAGIPLGLVLRRAARWGHGAMRRRALRRARARRGIT